MDVKIENERHEGGEWSKQTTQEHSMVGGGKHHFSIYAVVYLYSRVHFGHRRETRESELPTE